MRFLHRTKSLSLTKHVQKYPRNFTMNTKSSNFVKKWTKFQTKAQKCREIWCSNWETGRFDEKLGDSRENLLAGMQEVVMHGAGLTVCKVEQRVSVHLGHFVVFTNKYLPHINDRSPAGYCFVDFGDYTVSQKVMTKLSGLPIPGSNPVCIISICFKKKLKL